MERHQTTGELQGTPPDTTRPFPRQYRQGDVLLEQVGALPAKRAPLDRTIIAYGERAPEGSGHAHRLDALLADDARLFEDDQGNLWVQVIRPTPLVHEEHATLIIDPGIYRHVRQREYLPPPAPSNRPGANWNPERGGYHRYVVD